MTNRFILTVGCALAMHMAAAAQNTASPTNLHDLARSMSSAFADVYEHVSPGVVVIETQADTSQGAYAMGLNQWFMQRDPGSSPSETNQGSGFIITTDGYILTNNHVLEGATQEAVHVTLKDGRKFDAKIVGVDPISDLAVIKIDAPNLPVLDLGDSDKTRVGEFAFALGAPFDLRDTFTYGIVSAKGRTNIVPENPEYEEYIQTDASINPGNSGGPLVDIDGKVIGVNTLIRDLNRGLGFAIPINIAKKVATQLIASGRAVRPWLGIGIKSMDELPQLTQRYLAQHFPDLPKGLLVSDVYPGTPAQLSSLRLNDIIMSVDGKPVTNSRELQKAILGKKVGDEVSLQVWRNRRTMTVKLRTAEHTSGVMPVANQRLAPPAVQNFLDQQDDDSDQQDSSAAQQPPAPPVQPAAPPDPNAGLIVRTLTADTALAMKLQAEEGVLVTSVQPGSVAAAAGVQVGDVITSVGEKPVRTKQDFTKALDGAEGDAVILNINRGDEKTYEILKF